MAAVSGPDAVARALVAGRATWGAAFRPTSIARAPGRLELLGNHLDYNGGPVLAAAIDRDLVALVGPGSVDQDILDVLLADPPGRPRLTTPALTLAGWANASPPPHPLDYVRGAIAAGLARGTATVRPTARIVVAGDVPIGFGLSSSAALCVSLTLALHDRRPDDRELVLRAQEAEHRAGTPCGTMDQSASVAGGVMRFDGASLTVDRLSPDLGDHVFAVADSGVQRALGASSYPKRVEEARRALAIARGYVAPSLLHLAALDRTGLDRLSSLDRSVMPEILVQRVRHVVTETARVNEGSLAMAHSDWTAFGRLMTASGRSSATDYEISHPRVEELVAEALDVPGVLGARMMGGGEGGTALILLSRSSVPALEARLRDSYFARHDMERRADLIHVCSFARGAGSEDLAGR